MDHLTPDRLAALALEPDETGGTTEREHLEGCAECRAELNALVDLTTEIREARTAQSDAPSAVVWTNLLHEIGAGGESTRTEPGPADDGTGAGVGRRRVTGGRPFDRLREDRRGRAWARPAAAAAVGLVVGVGATLGILQATRSAQVVATTALSPLTGQTGTGTAELTRNGSSLQVRVRASLAPASASDFHEVWLINADGVRMYALGVLPASGTATFWVPSGLGDHLDGYGTVDISLEPDDGESAHSGHSLVQGRLQV